MCTNKTLPLDFLSGSESGNVAKGLLSFVLFLTVVILVIGYTFGQVVPPGTMGVRQIRLGPTQGFSRVALEPGYHWSIPFYSTIHSIPQTIQVLSLRANHAVSGDDMSGALEIQTRDGSSVFVDVSIIYRYYSRPSEQGEAKPHGGPSDLLQELRADPKRWMDQIESDASSRLKFRLGHLTTAQFYDPEKRQAMLQEALNDIQDRIAEYGIKAEGILLRRYRYTEEIDNAIFQKNLQEQEANLNQAKSRLAFAAAVLKDVTAQEDAKIETLRVEGENKARVIRSEGDLFETKKRSEGDLLVAQARADVDKLRASALATSTGAPVYIGKELAPLLSSLKGGVVTDIDPYNLGQWMERLGVQQK